MLQQEEDMEEKRIPLIISSVELFSNPSSQRSLLVYEIDTDKNLSVKAGFLQRRIKAMLTFAFEPKP